MDTKMLFVTYILILTVALPVLMVFGTDMFKRWLKHKERMAEVLSAATAEKAAQYAAHTERLEARVRVLERIATDTGTDLHREIEALRDDRLN